MCISEGSEPANLRMNWELLQHLHIWRIIRRSFSFLFFCWWALVESSDHCKGLICEHYEMCQMAPGWWTSGVFDLSKLIYRPPSQVMVAVRRSHSFFFQPVYLSATPADMLKRKRMGGGGLLSDTLKLIPGEEIHQTVAPLLPVRASDFRGVSSSHSRSHRSAILLVAFFVLAL